MDDIRELIVKRLHLLLQVNLLTGLTNLPSRLFDGRLGGSPDLMFGGGVERLNGAGKSGDCSLKVMFDRLKFVIKRFNLIPHHRQLAVHGLGGAFIFAGRDGFAGRLVMLLVKRLCNL
ncbi:3-oxoacyl-ACP synthase, putative [Babesia ovata]|uniref:3-oxoacyl-ACP synthase, putative n=1 Tax=Babesia ovata TaxID=189622 RepID=A0A2H6KIG3_9APIC|nr:3-oxoacyl-ACP synthase, putative [Babesia ovata]GBE62784.1 3-oxoacyl-ACP synthase, putative [Babesia ovata]